MQSVFCVRVGNEFSSHFTVNIFTLVSFPTSPLPVKFAAGEADFQLTCPDGKVEIVEKIINSKMNSH